MCAVYREGGSHELLRYELRAEPGGRHPGELLVDGEQRHQHVAVLEVAGGFVTRPRRDGGDGAGPDHGVRGVVEADDGG